MDKKAQNQKVDHNEYLIFFSFTNALIISFLLSLILSIFFLFLYAAFGYKIKIHEAKDNLEPLHQIGQALKDKILPALGTMQRRSWAS